jgi:hypothetical protein
MPPEVRWDEEMQSDIDTHESLLQQLNLSVDDEKTKHTVRLNASLVLTPVSTSSPLNRCMNSSDQVFDDFPSKVVVCDKEFRHSFDPHGHLLQLALWTNDQMQCKQDVFKAQVVSEYAALNVFSELLPSEVLLDDELLHYLDSQGGYFQQVTSNGEHLAGGDSKQMVEASIDDVLTHDSSAPLLLELSMDDVYEFDEMLIKDVVSDVEMLQDLHLCHGLLQKFVGDTEYMDNGSTELVIELDAIEIPNNISVTSPLVFEHGAETVDMLPGFVDSLM